MQVLRSAVRWIESYESSRKRVSSAVERWWSETGDGWLSFGFGSREDGDSTEEIAENENPGYVAQLAQRISSSFGGTEVVPGPDPRVQTKAFPAAYLQELEDMQRKAEEEWQAKCDAEMEAIQTEREGKMAQLDEDKAQVESEPLSEARIERLAHIEKIRLNASNVFDQKTAALEHKREAGLESLKKTSGSRQPDHDPRPETASTGSRTVAEPVPEPEQDPGSTEPVPGSTEPVAEPELQEQPEREEEPELEPEQEQEPVTEPEPDQDSTTAYVARRLEQLTTDLHTSLTQQLAPAPQPEPATDEDGVLAPIAALASGANSSAMPASAMPSDTLDGTGTPQGLQQGAADDRDDSSTTEHTAAEAETVPDAPEGEPPPSARSGADGFDDEDFDDLDDLVYKK